MWLPIVISYWKIQNESRIQYMINIQAKGDYTIIVMDSGKVNAINTDLARSLKEAFQELDADEAVKGVILTGRPHCFSAGLDVAHLATMGDVGGREFWRQYMGALQAMVRFSKPFVCAMTGYAPAGATIFTLCADYRIMGKGDKHKMGMHEFKMNMQIPEMLCDIYAYHLGEVQAWKAVQAAKLFSSDEALAMGLVDESVEVEEVMPRAEKHIQRLVNVYGKVYSKSKAIFRKDLRKIVDRDIEALIDDIITFNNDPYLKGMVEMFAASLKK